VAEFADAGLQASLKSLTKESGKAPAAKQAPKAQQRAIQLDTSTAPAKAKSGSPRALIFAVIAVVVLGMAGAAYWFLRPAPPAVPLAILELNATPFAEVVSVTSDKGKAIALPAGDHWTPLRLDEIPTGRYSVSFKGPDGSVQTQQCNAAQFVQICTIELKPVDDNAIDEIVGGAK
jgi:hypothetical protein